MRHRRESFERETGLRLPKQTTPTPQGKYYRNSENGLLVRRIENSNDRRLATERKDEVKNITEFEHHNKQRLSRRSLFEQSLYQIDNTSDIINVSHCIKTSSPKTSLQRTTSTTFTYSDTEGHDDVFSDSSIQARRHFNADPSSFVRSFFSTSNDPSISPVYIDVSDETTEQGSSQLQYSSSSQESANDRFKNSSQSSSRCVYSINSDELELISNNQTENLCSESHSIEEEFSARQEKAASGDLSSQGDMTIHSIPVIGNQIQSLRESNSFIHEHPGTYSHCSFPNSCPDQHRVDRFNTGFSTPNPCVVPPCQHLVTKWPPCNNRSVFSIVPQQIDSSTLAFPPDSLQEHAFADENKNVRQTIVNFNRPASSVVSGSRLVNGIMENLSSANNLDQNQTPIKSASDFDPNCLRIETCSDSSPPICCSRMMQIQVQTVRNSNSCKQCVKPVSTGAASRGKLATASGSEQCIKTLKSTINRNNCSLNTLKSRLQNLTPLSTDGGPETDPSPTLPGFVETFRKDCLDQSGVRSLSSTSTIDTVNMSISNSPVQKDRGACKITNVCNLKQNDARTRKRVLSSPYYRKKIVYCLNKEKVLQTKPSVEHRVIEAHGLKSGFHRPWESCEFSSCKKDKNSMNDTELREVTYEISKRNAGYKNGCTIIQTSIPHPKSIPEGRQTISGNTIPRKSSQCLKTFVLKRIKNGIQATDVDENNTRKSNETESYRGKNMTDIKRIQSGKHVSRNSNHCPTFVSDTTEIVECNLCKAYNESMTEQSTDTRPGLKANDEKTSNKNKLKHNELLKKFQIPLNKPFSSLFGTTSRSDSYVKKIEDLERKHKYLLSRTKCLTPTIATVSSSLSYVANPVINTAFSNLSQVARPTISLKLDTENRLLKQYEQTMKSKLSGTVCVKTGRRVGSKLPVRQQINRKKSNVKLFIKKKTKVSHHVPCKTSPCLVPVREGGNKPRENMQSRTTQTTPIDVNDENMSSVSSPQPNIVNGNNISTTLRHEAMRCTKGQHQKFWCKKLTQEERQVSLCDQYNRTEECGDYGGLKIHTETGVTERYDKYKYFKLASDSVAEPLISNRQDIVMNKEPNLQERETRKAYVNGKLTPSADTEMETEQLTNKHRRVNYSLTSSASSSRIRQTEPNESRLSSKGNFENAYHSAKQRLYFRNTVAQRLHEKIGSGMKDNTSNLVSSNVENMVQKELRNIHESMDDSDCSEDPNNGRNSSDDNISYQNIGSVSRDSAAKGKGVLGLAQSNHSKHVTSKTSNCLVSGYTAESLCQRLETETVAHRDGHGNRNCSSETTSAMSVQGKEWSPDWVGPVVENKVRNNVKKKTRTSSETVAQGILPKQNNTVIPQHCRGNDSSQKNYSGVERSELKQNHVKYSTPKSRTGNFASFYMSVPEDGVRKLQTTKNTLFTTRTDVLDVCNRHREDESVTSNCDFLTAQRVALPLLANPSIMTFAQAKPCSVSYSLVVSPSIMQNCTKLKTTTQNRAMTCSVPYSSVWASVPYQNSYQSFTYGSNSERLGSKCHGNGNPCGCVDRSKLTEACVCRSVTSNRTYSEMQEDFGMCLNQTFSSDDKLTATPLGDFKTIEQDDVFKENSGIDIETKLPEGNPTVMNVYELEDTDKYTNESSQGYSNVLDDVIAEMIDDRSLTFPEQQGSVYKTGRNPSSNCSEHDNLLDVGTPRDKSQNESRLSDINGNSASRTAYQSRIRSERTKRFQKKFPYPMPKAKPIKTTGTDETLYKDAVEFLADFDASQKRSCRKNKVLHIQKIQNEQIVGKHSHTYVEIVDNANHLKDVTKQVNEDPRSHDMDNAHSVQDVTKQINDGPIANDQHAVDGTVLNNQVQKPDMDNAHHVNTVTKQINDGPSTHDKHAADGIVHSSQGQKSYTGSAHCEKEVIADQIKDNLRSHDRHVSDKTVCNNQEQRTNSLKKVESLVEKKRKGEQDNTKQRKKMKTGKLDSSDVSRQKIMSPKKNQVKVDSLNKKKEVNNNEMKKDKNLESKTSVNRDSKTDRVKKEKCVGPKKIKTEVPDETAEMKNKNKKIPLLRIKNERSGMKIINSKKEPPKLKKQQISSHVNVVKKQLQVQTKEIKRETKCIGNQGTVDNMKYKCPACSETFNTESRMKRHCIDQHKEWCAQCKLKFPDRETRFRHVKRGHNIRMYCKVCEVWYINICSYRKHLTSNIHIQRAKPAVTRPKPVHNKSQKKPSKKVTSKTDTLDELPDIRPTTKHCGTSTSEMETDQAESTPKPVYNKSQKKPSHKVTSKIETVHELTDICPTTKHCGTSTHEMETDQAESRTYGSDMSRHTNRSRKEANYKYCKECKKSYKYLNTHLKTEKHLKLAKHLKGPEKLTSITEEDAKSKKKRGRPKKEKKCSPVKKNPVIELTYPQSTETLQSNKNCNPVLLIKNIASSWPSTHNRQYKSEYWDTQDTAMEHVTVESSGHDGEDDSIIIIENFEPNKENTMKLMKVNVENVYQEMRSGGQGTANTDFNKNEISSVKVLGQDQVVILSSDSDI